jgi:hypothetical protein
MEMVADFLPDLELNYFDLKDQAERVNSERDQRMLGSINELILYSFQDIKLEGITSYSPWNRMFECGLTFEIILKVGLRKC